MPTVQVSLDTSAIPPVTCNPKHVPMDRGKAPINWVPAEGQSFAFATLTGLPTSVFSNLTITNSEITVNDDNKNTGRNEIPYPYTLCVSYGNPSQTYCTGPSTGGNPGDPSVQNK